MWLHLVVAGFNSTTTFQLIASVMRNPVMTQVGGGGLPVMKHAQGGVLASRVPDYRSSGPCVYEYGTCPNTYCAHAPRVQMLHQSAATAVSNVSAF